MLFEHIDSSAAIIIIAAIHTNFTKLFHCVLTLLTVIIIVIIGVAITSTTFASNVLHFLPCLFLCS